jgi:serine/threonine protein kinase
MKSKVSIASAGINNINKEIDKFSSPELRLSKDYGLSTDIWSLGALLNYLLYETMDNIWEDCEEIKIEVP